MVYASRCFGFVRAIASTHSRTLENPDVSVFSNAIVEPQGIWHDGEKPPTKVKSAVAISDESRAAASITNSKMTTRA